MKRIPLKKLEPSGDGVPDNLNYRELIKAVLGLAPAGGLTVSEMGDRLSLIEQLKTCGDEAVFIDIEDGLHKDLVAALEANKWGMVSKNLVQFLSDVKNAPGV